MTDGRDASDAGLVLSLHSVPSTLRIADGREIPFQRAVLTLENGHPVPVVALQPHATLGQEGGTVQDVSGALIGARLPLAPGDAVRWDVYDLLLPAHQGTASKIHMFGHRAALNWRFELAVWVEYRLSQMTAAARTPAGRWTLRWSGAGAPAGAVALAVEERRD